MSGRKLDQIKERNKHALRKKFISAKSSEVSANLLEGSCILNLSSWEFLSFTSIQAKKTRICFLDHKLSTFSLHLYLLCH